MRVLVTGAAGFIGSHLAEALAGLGCDVVGLDAFTDYYPRETKERNAQAVRRAGAGLVEADLATCDLRPVLDGVDAVFHLAAQPGISAKTPLALYLRNNVVATARLVDACCPLPELRLFAHVSTSSVYGPVAVGAEETLPAPTSDYGITKLAAEHLVMAACRDRGLPACVLRIFSVYGPRERPEKLFPMLIRCIAEGRPFPLFDGAEAHTRSFTCVADVVRGCTAVLDRRDGLRGEVINLGTESTATTAEAIATVERIMGRKVTVQRVAARSGDQQATAAAIGKARRLLGYAPSTKLREGLESEVDWFVRGSLRG